MRTATFLKVGKFESPVERNKILKIFEKKINDEFQEKKNP
jgi:hypothetical protein